MEVILFILGLMTGLVIRQLRRDWRMVKLEVTLLAQQDNIVLLQAALKESLAERARLVAKLAEQ